MVIISTVLLLAYGAHVALLVLHGQNLGVTEVIYLIPMCFCLAVVWIWQSRNIPKLQESPPLEMLRQSCSGVELDELIEQRRLEDEVKAQSEIAEQQKNDQNQQRFLSGIQEWQARQRWMQEGR
ncbi:hypothetical protein LAV84_23850 [Rhizobium sp. VS19-DR104.2]|uniref:hypothetical protein n=1 Tax=unclassified Rhizobium TaxID=2613769 RepID=UPI001CC485B2|nr:MULTISPECIES: hypothetical protein [unclassified Rhizobium]MBZ5762294.1 hypothetical protein [Rhizobium sp. VS19-DR96]MBZ5768310.1 hypothetical protein [Rhizobium sp. VS19-DR129.2]MBZ5775818.1 hypothetical protein [Rhizobium sp. VS19-DRK62.2]MBZ5787161.1 hypothetical protein [Rhizobium sp. VS19-DR121]MBZ5804236.1 hypothetical protein [Rhizobium sp. VS19-DR181]